MKRTTTQILGVVLLATVLALTGQASAANYDFSVATGNWTTAGSWDPVTGPPVGGDIANINNGGTAQVTANLGTSALELYIGGSDSATGNNVLEINTGTTNSDGIQVGNWGNRNVGQVIIGSAGTSPHTSTLNIAVGRLQAVSTSNDILLRKNATVNLTDAQSLLRGHAGLTLAQPTSVLNLQAGTVWVEDTIVLESGSQFNQSGGSLDQDNETLNIRGGTYDISGGVANINTVIANSGMIVSGSADVNVLDLNIGWNTASTLSVIGTGSIITAGNLDLAALNNGSGTLNPQIDATGVTAISATDVSIGTGGGGLLKPEALAGAEAGTYTVLTWSGTLTGESNFGFDASVDTDLWSYDFDTTNKQLTVTYVPEPATLALLGMGGLALLRRRTRQA